MVDGHVINPIFIGAMPYQTSKFDNNLESDADSGSFVFETGRLEQFTEYDDLKGCNDED